MENISKRFDLKKMYDILNLEYFDNKLPSSDMITLEWSTRLTSVAGKCWGKKRLIKLSVPYHQKFPEEVKLTLAHEMIHLKICNHSSAFYRELKRLNDLGLPVRRYSLEKAVVKQPRWKYSCSNPNCKMQTNRIRKVPSHYVCGKCLSKLIETYIGDETQVKEKKAM